MIRHLAILSTLICGLFNNANLSAQTVIDSISLAREIRDNGKLSEAADVLHLYTINHPQDVNAFWLYAETEYWLQHFKKSKQLYERAITLAPSHAYLQLDYARMLLNTRDYDQSQSFLTKLVNYDLTRLAANIELARLHYWKGDLKKAKYILGNILKNNPDNKESLNLLEEVRSSSAPWLKIASGFTSDSQPLKVLNPSIEMGKTYGRCLTPYIGLYSPVFSWNNKSSLAKSIVVGNNFSFAGLGLDVGINGGVFVFPDKKANTLTGTISIKKSFLNHIVFNALAERKPYLNTVSSMDTAISVNHFYTSIRHGVISQSKNSQRYRLKPYLN